jgi:hypothetical protein
MELSVAMGRLYSDMGRMFKQWVAACPELWLPVPQGIPFHQRRAGEINFSLTSEKFIKISSYVNQERLL